jgi:hypothetical protein
VYVPEELNLTIVLLPDVVTITLEPEYVFEKLVVGIDKIIMPEPPLPPLLDGLAPPPPAPLPKNGEASLPAGPPQ